MGQQHNSRKVLFLILRILLCDQFGSQHVKNYLPDAYIGMRINVKNVVKNPGNFLFWNAFVTHYRIVYWAHSLVSSGRREPCAKPMHRFKVIFNRMFRLKIKYYLLQFCQKILFVTSCLLCCNNDMVICHLVNSFCAKVLVDADKSHNLNFTVRSNGNVSATLVPPPVF